MSEYFRRLFTGRSTPVAALTKREKKFLRQYLLSDLLGLCYMPPKKDHIVMKLPYSRFDSTYITEKEHREIVELYRKLK
jgi:hypothetical protein